MKTAAARNSENFNFGEYLKEQHSLMHANYMAGMDYAETQHRTIMRAIANAYEAALADPKTVIPTSLHVMLEAVRETVKGY